MAYLRCCDRVAILIKLGSVKICMCVHETRCDAIMMSQRHYSVTTKTRLHYLKVMYNPLTSLPFFHHSSIKVCLVTRVNNY